MAASYSTALKTARMQKIIDLIDAGAGNGYLEIYTAGFALKLGTLTLQKPSWTASGDHITLNGTPADIDADATGQAAIARIKDSNGNVVINNMSVGVGEGFEIQINAVNVEQHVQLTLTGGTITHAA